MGNGISEAAQAECVEGQNVVTSVLEDVTMQVGA